MNHCERDHFCGYPNCHRNFIFYEDFLLHLDNEHHPPNGHESKLVCQYRLIRRIERKLAKEKALLEQMVALRQEQFMLTCSVKRYQDEMNLNEDANRNKIRNHRFPDEIFCPRQEPIMPQNSGLNKDQEYNDEVRKQCLLIESAARGQNHFMPRSSVKRCQSKIDIICDVKCPTIEKPWLDRWHEERKFKARMEALNFLNDAERIRYRGFPLKPPETYVGLIRQAIAETPERRLSVHCIYKWFRDTFAYFQLHLGNWKATVRQTLAKEKCFKKIVQGDEVRWTVDDNLLQQRIAETGKKGRKRKAGTNLQMPPM
ncbi:hypothetical protein ACOME3_007266 [Neoechinorhynchus agilis]